MQEQLQSETAEEDIIQEALNASIEFMPSEDFLDTTQWPVFLEPLKSTNHTVRKAPPGLPPYLAALYEVPLLLRDEEQHQFRKMNLLRYIASHNQEKLRAARGEDKITVAQTVHANIAQSVEIHRDIIRRNLRLVVSIAKKFGTNDSDFLDNIQEGNIALMRAVDLFDYSKRFRFSTYATWVVRNVLIRHNGKKNAHNYRFSQLSDEFDARDPKEVRQFDELMDQSMIAMIQEGVSQLKDRDQKIIMRRFGFGGQKPLKFREIAEEFHISTERVRQLVDQAIMELRAILSLND